MTPTSWLAVLVDGETITGVVPTGEVPSEYTAVDLRGGYLMPGLINLHVHIPGSGKPTRKQADTKRLVKLITSNGLMRKIGMNLCASYAKMELMSGVTTIRTVGGIQDFDSRLRDQINQGKVVGPRILVGNMAISVPAIPYALFDPTVSRCDEMGQYNGKIVFEGIVECAKTCLSAGVPVGLGTDTGCPFVTHYDMWRELHTSANSAMLLPPLP